MSMTFDERIAVIRAHINGWTIEVRIPSENTGWYVIDDPKFDFINCEYRSIQRPATPPVLRPHWMVVVLDRGEYYLSHSLWETLDAARPDFTDPAAQPVRLATEYPPVMLP